MLLKNHIATRLLADPYFWVEVTEEQKRMDTKRGVALPEETYTALFHMLSADNNKSYYITRSVTDKLHLFDSKKVMEVTGWSVFRNLPDFKKTFIIAEENIAVRIRKWEGLIWLCYMRFDMHPAKLRTEYEDGSLYWNLLYVDLDKGKMAETWQNPDSKEIAPFIYSLLCFVELTENETIVVEPGRKYGTRKQGKLINTLPTPVIIVNNTWNITTVRTDGFPVSGHVALRWAGPEGAKYAKMVYIEPYMKSGYTRRAGKELHNQ